MKHLLLVLNFSVFISPFSFSQDCPIGEKPEIIKSNKIKSISIKFNSISDLQELDSLEVSKIEIDNEGRISNEKYFRLFDVVLYSEEFIYTYDEQGSLIQKIGIQVDYPKNKQDSSLVEITGYEPSTTKWVYKYDQNNRLILEYEFLDQDDAKPTLLAEYKYDANGNNIKTIFQNINFPNHTTSSNRIEYYKYDNYNRLIETKMMWTTSDEGFIETIEYNEEGNIVLESRTRNNGKGSKTVYTYTNGRKTLLERYRIGKAEPFSITKFKYNSNNCLIEEIINDKWIETFECNVRGFRSSEYWYQDNGEAAFSFDTTYEYYK